MEDNYSDIELCMLVEYGALKEFSLVCLDCLGFLPEEENIYDVMITDPRLTRENLSAHYTRKRKEYLDEIKDIDDEDSGSWDDAEFKKLMRDLERAKKYKHIDYPEFLNKVNDELAEAIDIAVCWGCHMTADDLVKMCPQIQYGIAKKITALTNAALREKFKQLNPSNNTDGAK